VAWYSHVSNTSSWEKKDGWGAKSGRAEGDIEVQVRRESKPKDRRKHTSFVHLKRSLCVDVLSFHDWMSGCQKKIERRESCTYNRHR
jgi:hypothetical protein